MGDELQHVPSGRDPAVQALLDREAIRDCLARYARAIDRRDFALMRNAYWQDAMDEHGAVSRPVDAYIEWVSKLTESWVRTMHVLGQTLIQIEGAKAVSETYFSAFHLRPNEKGKLHEEFIAGRYLDVLEKREDEWRIYRRTVAYEFFKTSEEPFHPEPGPAGRRRMGAHKPDDPIYALLQTLTQASLSPDNPYKETSP